MKKANIIALALFAAAAVAGALFVGGSYGASAQTTTVMCSPSSVSALPGQSITLSASGGDGTNYQWSSPGLTVTNPYGTNFNVSFTADGTYPVTVTSGGSSATCNVMVSGAAVPSTPITTTTPGLPDTGALPE
jgi:hypothetical protein